MKVRSEDILKPGALLEVKEIDFTDPDVIKFVKDSKARQRQILRMRIVSSEKLRQIITI
jgi:hypothetical protein